MRLDDWQAETESTTSAFEGSLKESFPSLTPVRTDCKKSGLESPRRERDRAVWNLLKIRDAGSSQKALSVGRGVCRFSCPSSLVKHRVFYTRTQVVEIEPVSLRFGVADELHKSPRKRRAAEDGARSGSQRTAHSSAHLFLV